MWPLLLPAGERLPGSCRPMSPLPLLLPLLLATDAPPPETPLLLAPLGAAPSAAAAMLLLPPVPLLLPRRSSLEGGPFSPALGSGLAGARCWGLARGMGPWQSSCSRGARPPTWSCRRLRRAWGSASRRASFCLCLPLSTCCWRLWALGRGGRQWTSITQWMLVQGTTSGVACAARVCVPHTAAGKHVAVLPSMPVCVHALHCVTADCQHA